MKTKIPIEKTCEFIRLYSLSKILRKRLEPAIILTLSRPEVGVGGGGGIITAATLSLNDFIYLGKIWCGRLVFIDFDVTMATNFDKKVFQEWKIPF